MTVKSELLIQKVLSLMPVKEELPPSVQVREELPARQRAQELERPSPKRGEPECPLPKRVTKGDLHQSPVTKGDLHQSPVTKGDLHQSPVTKGDLHQSPVTKGDLHQSPVTKGDLHQSPVTKGDLHQFPVTEGELHVSSDRGRAAPVSRVRGLPAAPTSTTRGSLPVAAPSLAVASRGSTPARFATARGCQVATARGCLHISVWGCVVTASGSFVTRNSVAGPKKREPLATDKAGGEKTTSTCNSFTAGIRSARVSRAEGSITAAPATAGAASLSGKRSSFCH
ncbi:UNVERIFIED_CONTAM: hypothetical protein FKN15_039356 [Acipenser sinensis]